MGQSGPQARDTVSSGSPTMEGCEDGLGRREAMGWSSFVMLVKLTCVKAMAGRSFVNLIGIWYSRYPSSCHFVSDPQLDLIVGEIPFFSIVHPTSSMSSQKPTSPNSPSASQDQAHHQRPSNYTARSFCTTDYHPRGVKE